MNLSFMKIKTMHSIFIMYLIFVMTFYANMHMYIYRCTSLHLYIVCPKSMVTVNVKCLSVNCKPTFGPTCICSSFYMQIT